MGPAARSASANTAFSCSQQVGGKFEGQRGGWADAAAGRGQRTAGEERLCRPCSSATCSPTRPSSPHAASRDIAFSNHQFTLPRSAVSADSACSRCCPRSSWPPAPAAPAASRICCSAASRSAWLRATTVTLQPRAAHRRASARPSPLEPPVMRTCVAAPRRRAPRRRHSAISAAGAIRARSVRQAAGPQAGRGSIERAGRSGGAGRAPDGWAHGGADNAGVAMLQRTGALGEEGRRPLPCSSSPQ